MFKKFTVLSVVCATIISVLALPVIAQDPYCCYEYNAIGHYDSNNCCLTNSTCPLSYSRTNPGSLAYQKCSKAATEWCPTLKRMEVEKRRKKRSE